MNHSAKPTEFSIQWLIPNTLEIDRDLIVEDGNGEQYFSDNLGIQIKSNDLDFTVYKRHTITFCGSMACIHPEGNWNWDEHGELDTAESEALEEILKTHNGKIVPSEEYAQQLRLKFQTH